MSVGATRLAALVLAVGLAGPRAARADFSDSLRGQLAPLGGALGESVARSIPLVSASSPFRYAFDPRTNVFERLPGISGQVYLESAETLERGRFNLSTSYEYVSFAEVDGADLDDLVSTETLPIVPGLDLRLIQDLHLTLNVHQVAIGLTYGLTDAAEVNLTVPLLYSRFALSGEVTGQLVARPAGNVISQRTTRAPGSSMSAAGVGDLVLRGKYRVWEHGGVPVGLGLALRLPSGNEDDFQGTGDVGVIPSLFVSTLPRSLTPGITLAGRVNAGVDIDASHVDRSEARWGLGLDFGFADRGAVAVAILGRNAFSETLEGSPPSCLPGGTISFEDPCIQTLAGESELGLLGVSTGRPDFFDLSIGGRVVVWDDRLVFFANVLVPLNDDGFRARAIPLAGLEALF
jgi:hypothetical protein